MRIRHVEAPLGSGCDGPMHAPHYGLGVHCGTVDGVALGCMFRRAIRGKSLPKYLSSDQDPLYRFHPWKANLRVLDVTEIKTVPYVPLSHPEGSRYLSNM